ncbi:MAG: peptide chain release factor N(5)-glutamine methyltransferase [Bacteroidetes bacterium]|nr:MAG: peptide chain release factor N(5)-glutamine methyltransferase [Bacteroidota bacterium]
MAISSHLQAFRRQLLSDLQPLYARGEAEAIVRRLLEHLIDAPAHRWRGDPDYQLSPAAQAAAEVATARLLAGEPIQHIIGYAPFFDHDFVVSPAVLIPRQETEELVQWVLDDHRAGPALRLVDIGTGTGCLPISLDLALRDRYPQRECWGVDLSPEALAVARTNGDRLQSEVQWREADLFALGPEAWQDLDVLISNPPYVPQHERATLAPHVKGRDPDLALFVPDEDPLLFYRELARLAPHWLRPGGYLYLEIHADFAAGVVALCEAAGAKEVVLRPDLSGRDRMVRACW